MTVVPNNFATGSERHAWRRPGEAAAAAAAAAPERQLRPRPYRNRQASRNVSRRGLQQVSRLGGRVIADPDRNDVAVKTLCMRRKYTVERYRQKLRYGGSNRLRRNPDAGFGKMVADEVVQPGERYFARPVPYRERCHAIAATPGTCGSSWWTILSGSSSGSQARLMSRGSMRKSRLGWPGAGPNRPGPVERDVLTGPVLRRERETETLARCVVRAAPGGDLTGADLDPGGLIAWTRLPGGVVGPVSASARPLIRPGSSACQ